MGSRTRTACWRSASSDYATAAGYFGGIAAGRFRVVLFANPGGAYHFGCDATDLFCDARTVPAADSPCQSLGSTCTKCAAASVSRAFRSRVVVGTVATASR